MKSSHRTSLRGRVRAKARALALELGDRWHNLRYASSRRHILVLRQHYVLDSYNDHFLGWLRAELPAEAARFKLARAPLKKIRDWKDIGLVLSWVQDPVKEHYPQVYRSLKQIEAEADARGIPVLNRADAMSNSIKSRAAAIISSVGIRVAKMHPITDPSGFRRDLGGMALPLILRENAGHGGRTYLVKDADAVSAAPIEQMSNPVAVEFIDTRLADGLYRKYRYIALGNGTGAPRSCVISKNWEVRAATRVRNDATRDEELDHLRNPARDAAAFERARNALGLGFVAFDYSYTSEGELVIWEANPAPILRLNRVTKSGEYQAPYIRHLYCQMLKYYLSVAGIEPSNDVTLDNVNMGNRAY